MAEGAELDAAKAHLDHIGNAVFEQKPRQAFSSRTMRRATFAILLALPIAPAMAQQLFFEDFEDGAATTSFALNVAENGSLTDVASSNKWIINNAYDGGTATLMCTSRRG